MVTETEKRKLPIMGEALSLDKSQNKVYILTTKGIIAFDTKGEVKSSSAVFSYSEKIFVYDNSHIFIPSSDFLNAYRDYGEKIKLLYSVGIPPFYTHVLKTKRGVMFLYRDGKIEIFHPYKKKFKKFNLKTSFKKPVVVENFLYWIHENALYGAGLWSMKKKKITKVEEVKALTQWRNLLLVEESKKLSLFHKFTKITEIEIDYDSLVFHDGSSVLIALKRDSFYAFYLPTLKFIKKGKKRKEQLIMPFGERILVSEIKIVKEKQPISEKLFFALQIGAFKDSLNAVKYVDSLSFLQLPLYVKKENDLYKVRIGYFSKREDAKYFKRFLKNLPCWIVKEKQIEFKKENYEFEIPGEKRIKFIYKDGIIKFLSP